MQTLQALGAEVAARLKARKETIAVAESSAGGLINAALVAVPGASAYYLGGEIIYTGAARERVLGITREEMTGLRSASEPYARLVARRVREQLGATWGLAETGASGPTGNRYGDAAGHSCFGIVGLAEASMTLETGASDRLGNMNAFTSAALNFLLKTVSK